MPGSAAARAYGPGVGPGNAEFVPGAAGGDLGVRRGIHVRIDPQRDAGGAADAGREADSMSSSSALSTLIWPMSSASARRRSRSDLPTPENTMCAGGMPAARARRSSPSLTTSAPAPSAANKRRTARWSLAFMA